MAGTQLLRVLVNERLAAAALEIFGLVEKTIAEYQDEVVRSRTEIIQLRKQLEQLTILKPEVVLLRADIQSVSEEILPSQQPDQLPTVKKNEPLEIPLVQVDTFPPLCPSDTKPVSEELLPSLQQCDIKAEQIQEYPQVKEEQVYQCIGPVMEADTYDDSIDFFPLPAPVTVSVNESIEIPLVRVDTFPPLGPSDTKPVSEELLPSLQQCDIKAEQIQEYPQVKEEQVDQCIGPDVEADTYDDSIDFFPLPAPVTVSVNKSIDDKQDESIDDEQNESIDDKQDESIDDEQDESIDDEQDESDDSSSPPDQSHSVEVYVELEQPPRDEKSCRFCGETFIRDSVLIWHVEKSHKGQKAFKCLKCNKEFDRRYHLIQHVRIHTGEKPYSCDFCDKTFSQNSSRIVHMRVHTGEKPYYCAKCGKSFASSSHFKFCKMKELKSAPEKVNTDENPKEEEKIFKCSECSKMFRLKQHLVLHQRVHTGEKPFRCNVCCKKFSQSSSRIVHMKVHTGEKPYLCKDCGKRFASNRRLMLCTQTKKSEKKSFRCATCGRFFHTELDLNMHMQVHESWKQHMSEYFGVKSI